MRLLLCALCLAVAAPAALAATPSDGETVSTDDDRLAQRGAKKKKKKKGKKKGEEPETPPPPPPDTDGDGVEDGTDKCPEEAEDADGHEDGDGCPDPDNDGDGLPDAEDDCPDEAESLDGFDDADGCPEPEPTIKPLDAKITLNDGTTITGTVIRIIAVDEDEPESKPEQPETFDVIVDDVHEFATTWDNVRSLKSEKVKFTEAVDCYSEGAEMFEAPFWECTLKHPTVVKLDSSDRKGTHRFLDRKMKRLDFQFSDIACEGASCEEILESSTVSLYLYKLIAFEQNEDEAAAVTALQGRLREMQKKQVATATFQPAATE